MNDELEESHLVLKSGPGQSEWVEFAHVQIEMEPDPVVVKSLNPCRQFQVTGPQLYFLDCHQMQSNRHH